MAEKTKQDLLRWIEAEILTADSEKKPYLEEIAGLIRSVADRRSHMSWVMGDLDFNTPPVD